jgi:hypothetical protein
MTLPRISRMATDSGWMLPVIGMSIGGNNVGVNGKQQATKKNPCFNFARGVILP